MKRVTENTKITLTISQIRQLIYESLDYYRCHKCKNSVREDHFSLPSLFDEYRIPENQRKTWNKFIDAHLKEIYDLGIDSGRYGMKFNPVCEQCCGEICKDPRYKKLLEQWKMAQTEDLGGEDNAKTLMNVAKKVSDNMETIKSELQRRYGNLMKIYGNEGRIYRRESDREEIGGIYLPYINIEDASKLKELAAQIENGEPYNARLSAYAYTNTWDYKKAKKTFDLGIDLITASKEDVVKAVDDNWNEIWRFL